MQTVFYIAASVAVLLVGAGIFWMAYQVVYLLKHVRLILLPQVELTLTEVQKNLNNVEELSKDLDTTVEGANQLVASANQAVASVGGGIDNFNKRVAIPAMILAASAREGVKAGWTAFQAKKTQPKIVVIQDPAREMQQTDLGVYTR